MHGERRVNMRASSLMLCLVSALAATGAFAQRIGPPAEENPAVHQPTDPAARIGDAPQMIVRFRSTNSSNASQIQSSTGGESPAQGAVAAPSSVVAKFAGRSGLAIKEVRGLMSGMHLLHVDPRAGESFEEQIERVRSDPDVEFAVADERRFAHAVPTDPLFTGQWYLQNAQPAAINAQAAWDTSVGTAGVVIAVIDTGVLYSHPDLKRANIGGRLLPGYDFITQVAIANDGNGRDSDATDAGDFISASDAAQQQFQGCGVSSSSWHGTRVSGIIGALSNNAVGVTGITWNPWILPARALGKCGGFDSDIIDAMAWAAGRHINGVPDNPYPAKIENLSLGSTETCPASYASVVADLATTGVLVVASAGNEGGPVDTPANCPGVAAITGLRHIGTKVGFASLGPEVALGAPGGNCVNTGAGQPCLFSIDTTTNDGATTAGNNTYTDQINFNVGTSFSAPIVSGIAGLMASVNGNLGSAQLLARLKEGATTPFPVSTDPTVPMCHVPVASNPNDIQAAECSCTTSTCGAGMANAVGALNAALRPIAAVVRPASVAGGQPVALSGAGSAGACNRSIASYSWTVLNGGAGTFNPTNTAATTFNNAPTSGSVTVRLTVTDDVGKQDTADITITPTTTSSAAPANAGNTACPTAIQPPPPVSVTVAPATATVQADIGTQTFTATVTNTTNLAVTWAVNGVAGGNSTVGTISAVGVYSAPLAVPAAAVTVTAVSVDDPTRSGSAQVTITAPPPVGVMVSPTTASVPASGGTQTFTATVTNTTNTAVTWAVNGMVGGDTTVGTISAFGVYTAPAAVPTNAMVTVTATSVRDTTRSASATVTITAPGTQPASSTGGGGGGGGGALDLLGLLALVTLGRRFAPKRLRAQRAS
jgi:serine protease